MQALIQYLVHTVVNKVSTSAVFCYMVFQPDDLCAMVAHTLSLFILLSSFAMGDIQRHQRANAFTLHIYRGIGIFFFPVVVAYPIR